MKIFGGSARSNFAVAALCLMTIVAGCRSSQEKANDAAIAQAKQQAAASGTAQQVASVDQDGTTTTTVVQPPVAGQTTQQITTTKTTRSTTSAPAVAPMVQPANNTSGAALAPGRTSAGYGSGDGSTAPSYAAASAPAVAPGSPVITPVDVHVPRGTTLAIRINQHISVKTSRPGEQFTGEVVTPVSAEGSDRVVIPRGTPVTGVIDEAHRRGHFKGASILGLRLTSMNLNGQRYALDTRDNVRTKKGKGKRTAAFIGGGSGLGMLIGGVASGGVGLVVGGLAGAGAGTAISGLTGNRDLDIPSESIVNFRLAEDLVMQPRLL